MTTLSDRIRAVLAIDRAAPAIEFEGRWRTWGEISGTADDVDRALAAAGLGPGATVGVMVRNQPAAIGLVLGVLRAGACLVVVNPQLGVDRVRADLEQLDVALLAGTTRDVDAIVDDAQRARSAVIALPVLRRRIGVARALRRTR